MRKPLFSSAPFSNGVARSQKIDFFAIRQLRQSTIRVKDCRLRRQVLTHHLVGIFLNRVAANDENKFRPSLFDFALISCSKPSVIRHASFTPRRARPK